MFCLAKLTLGFPWFFWSADNPHLWGQTWRSHQSAIVLLDQQCYMVSVYLTVLLRTCVYLVWNNTWRVWTIDCLLIGQPAIRFLIGRSPIQNIVWSRILQTNASRLASIRHRIEDVRHGINGLLHKVVALLVPRELRNYESSFQNIFILLPDIRLRIWHTPLRQASCRLLKMCYLN